MKKHANETAWDQAEAGAAVCFPLDRRTHPERVVHELVEDQAADRNNEVLGEAFGLADGLSEIVGWVE